MKKIALIVSTLFLTSSVLLFSCSDSKSGGNDTAQTDQTNSSGTTDNSQSEVHGSLIKAEDVQLTTPLNAEWVSTGKSIYEMKCQSCHKLTADKVVGPGWEGLTKKREPHWIMNMITNVDIMLEKDPEAQKLLEQCLVRMPNQNVSQEEARKILEFMRSNDGVK